MLSDCGLRPIDFLVERRICSSTTSASISTSISATLICGSDSICGLAAGFAGGLAAGFAGGLAAGFCRRLSCGFCRRLSCGFLRRRRRVFGRWFRGASGVVGLPKISLGTAFRMSPSLH